MEIRRTLREILHRVSNPGLLFSHAFGLFLKVYDFVSPLEFSRTYRKVKDLTMCSNARLRGLHRAVKYVVENDIAGEVVECGTARGGSAALMALTLKELDDRERKVWVFDTFEGLPPPTSEDPDYDIARLYTGTCLGTLEDVTTEFQRLEVYSQMKLVKGLFQDTLPVSDTGTIAVLHIDGDWYNSVKSCLENLYDRVAEGGVIQIDDYGYWEGARKAVDEFFSEQSIVPAMKRLDYSGRQFIKPTQ